jgi:hypothetical protein
MLFKYGLHWQYAGYLKGFAISRFAKPVTKPPPILRKPTGIVENPQKRF